MCTLCAVGQQLLTVQVSKFLFCWCGKVAARAEQACQNKAEDNG